MLANLSLIPLNESFNGIRVTEMINFFIKEETGLKSYEGMYLN